MNPTKFTTITLATAVGFAAGVAVMWSKRPSGAAVAVAPAAEKSRATPRASAPSSREPAAGDRPLASDLQEASTKRRNGDYVLDSDIPSLRTRRENFEQTAVERIMAERDAEYAQLYAKLGIDPAVSAQLRQHLALIYKAKLQASVALQELAGAKSDYDRRMQKLLGDNFDVYDRYEAGQPARRESGQFADFLSQNGLTTLSDHDREVLEKQFQDHQAYSPRTLSHRGGPYEDVPPPVSGRWAVPYAQGRVDTFKENAAALMTAVRESSLPPTTVTALETYLGTQLEVANNDLTRMNPAFLQIKMVSRMLEQQRARPNPDPATIASMEAELARLQASLPKRE
jgi:hypothetical protein